MCVCMCVCSCVLEYSTMYVGGCTGLSRILMESGFVICFPFSCCFAFVIVLTSSPTSSHLPFPHSASLSPTFRRTQTRSCSCARVLAYQQLGVPDSLVFDTTDLHSAKDLNAVISCIYALAAATPSTPDLLSEEAERARSARRNLVGVGRGWAVRWPVPERKCPSRAHSACRCPAASSGRG